MTLFFLYFLPRNVVAFLILIFISYPIRTLTLPAVDPALEVIAIPAGVLSVSVVVSILVAASKYSLSPKEIASAVVAATSKTPTSSKLITSGTKKSS